MIALEDFLPRCPTPWHTAAESARQLAEAGFQELSATEPAWNRQGSGAYVQDGGFLFAWRWPESWRVPRLAVAHTDSPYLRLKPQPVRSLVEGSLSLSIETYGGLIATSWFDRPLEISGRVFLKGRGVCLVRLDSPRPVIPSLAVHFSRNLKNGGEINSEQELRPLLGLAPNWSPETAVAAALGSHQEDVLGWELCLTPSTAPARIGMNGELLLAPRLDNLASCHALISALLDIPADAGAFPILALFDGEEIGSEIASGARSPRLSRLLERLSLCWGLSRERFLAALASMRVLSVDMAHAVHPNYASMHDPALAPKLGGGPVLKVNASYRYATDAVSTADLRRAARTAGVPLQEFAMRADFRCGSTVGPALAAGLGTPVVDVGAPMLAMHSSEELMALADQKSSIALYRSFLQV